jgi:galactose oxidase
MPDARIFTGGGGLCGKCQANHLNIEIFTPPYLLDDDGAEAERPEIIVSSPVAIYGSMMNVTSTQELKMISLIRHGSATHSTNMDQRRVELCGAASTLCEQLLHGDHYSVKIPGDPGIAPPALWMVFGVNTAGVPSIASTVRVGVR